MSIAFQLPSAREAFYAEKQESYFDGARSDFIARLPGNPDAVVLEIGCGSGATGALGLAEGRAGRWIGVELSPDAAARARQRISEVIVGDIEAMVLEWPEESFDALVLSEVLEHLVEPWTVLGRLARLVRPNGVVLASSPNVAHWRVLREIAAGRFNLADEGVFDRTHMRWFTPATFKAMFEGAGFDVVQVGPVTPFSGRTRLISRATGGRLDHLFMVQIAVEGRRR